MEFAGLNRRFSFIACLLCACFFFLLSLVLGVATSHASNAETPTCASSVPPPAQGPTTVLPAQAGIIMINEVLPSPHSQWNCDSTEAQRNIWIELFNPHDQAFDLYGARAFLDTGPETPTVRVPFGATIAARGFLVLFPFDNAQLVASTLRLRVGDTTIDSISFPSLGSDISYARQPDGGSFWGTATSPTINASNVPPQPTEKPTKAPTPTKTPKPTPTPTPTRTATPRPGTNRTTHPQVDGTQPAWHTLALAVVPSPTPAAAIQTHRPAVGSHAEPDDLPRKLLLTLLTTALAAALLWSFWLFYGTRQNL